MEKIICLLILLCGSTWSSSQTAADLISKAESFGYRQIDSAVIYWNAGGTLALAEGNEEMALSAWDKASGSCLFLDQNEQAVAIFKKMWAIAKTDLEKGNILNGLTYQYVYDKSFAPDSIFELAITHATQTKDPKLLVATKGNFGVYLQQVGRYEEAMIHFIEALNHGAAPLQKLTLCINIAQLFLQLDNPNRAKEYIDQGVKICEDNKYKARNQKMAIQLGRYYRFTGQRDLAVKEFRAAIEHAINSPNNSLCSAYMNLSEIELNEGQIARSEALLDSSRAVKFANGLTAMYRQDLIEAEIQKIKGNFNRAAEIASSVLQTNKIKFAQRAAHELLSEIFEASNKPSKAFYHYKQFQKIEAELSNTNQAIQTFEQESKYKRKQQTDAITFLDQQNQIKEFKLKEKNWIIILGGIGLLIFSILSVLLYRFYQEVKEQRNIIKESLDEKEILLREIHHRVKNNMQMVSSLLSLQSRYIDDNTAKDAIKQSQYRVRTMALIHQDLYSNDNLKGVGVKEYLHRLCGELYDAYNITPDEIGLKMDIIDIDLDIDTMIPIGLIINELVTNALKYAFPYNREGWIKIQLKEDHQHLVLEVSDNGIGFEYEPEKNKSFGYKLVQTLIKRLKGELTVDSTKGTKTTIRFFNKQNSTQSAT